MCCAIFCRPVNSICCRDHGFLRFKHLVIISFIGENSSAKMEFIRKIPGLFVYVCVFITFYVLLILGKKLQQITTSFYDFSRKASKWLTCKSHFHVQMKPISANGTQHTERIWVLVSCASFIIDFSIELICTLYMYSASSWNRFITKRTKHNIFCFKYAQILGMIGCNSTT